MAWLDWQKYLRKKNESFQSPSFIKSILIVEIELFLKYHLTLYEVRTNQIVFLDCAHTV